MKLELRAFTNSDLNRDSAVMMSSTMPSAKCSCPASPLMFWNGSTAIEGLSGSASGEAGSITLVAGCLARASVALEFISYFIKHGALRFQCAIGIFTETPIALKALVASPAPPPAVSTMAFDNLTMDLPSASVLTSESSAAYFSFDNSSTGRPLR